MPKWGGTGHTLLTSATGWRPKKGQVSESWTATDSEQVLPVVPLPIIPTDRPTHRTPPRLRGQFAEPMLWRSVRRRCGAFLPNVGNTQKTKQTKYCYHSHQLLHCWLDSHWQNVRQQKYFVVLQLLLEAPRHFSITWMSLAFLKCIWVLN